MSEKNQLERTVSYYQKKETSVESNCVFCKIIARTIPAQVIAENEHLLVIQDIAPKAPLHYLIIPKIHVRDLASLAPQDSLIAEKIFMMAQELAKKLSESQSFRFVINNGPDAGQTVFHLHAHFLSGKKMLDL